MTPESQRKAMAEACGWKIANGCDWYNPNWPGAMNTWGLGESRIPDYLNDLNAMHEAEKTLGHHYLRLMEALLQEVCGERFRIFHATAAQRAEAFLRTISKWDDSK